MNIFGRDKEVQDVQQIVRCAKLGEVESRSVGCWMPRKMIQFMDARIVVGEFGGKSDSVSSAYGHCTVYLEGRDPEPPRK